MDIQWYPGHMTKTIRQMKEDIKLVDLVIEITDARIPLSARNPDIDGLAAGKARMLILNKADLADETESRRWVSYFREQGITTILMDARARGNVKAITPAIYEACREKIERDKRKGMKERPIRAMVAGIPNTGKSTFINSFSGKAMARTGNKPGVTRGHQWIRLGGRVELLDTPGLLWPKFNDPKVGENIALIGSINDQILDQGELAVTLIERLRKEYPGILAERYGIEEEGTPAEILERIGTRRGCLKKGGIIDYDRVSSILLDEFRSGALGRITLEKA
ncbi:MAG TPA: ribosome biogenesis GTPase YlqF [Lachnospiraceae bacterium]|nr:ribosome biogenesis GTPase YlqF [Lachnospiraceae bacterium]